jgi:hypothetical protein
VCIDDDADRFSLPAGGKHRVGAVDGLLFQRRGEIGNGAVVLAPAHICIAAIIVGVDILGIQADRLGIIRDRGIEVAPDGVRQPAIVEGSRQIGVELDRLGVIGNGEAKLSLAAYASPRLLNAEARFGSSSIARS